MIRAIRVLIAPDSFKGTLAAADAAVAIRRGLVQANPAIDADLAPLSDGGEGFLQALQERGVCRLLEQDVTGPTGEQVRAMWGRGCSDAGSGFIELAQAAGLGLAPESQRNPLKATTSGVGELIRAAISSGCSRLSVGLGGSATCDGGVGIVQALGGRFFNRDGDLLTAPIRGEDLISINSFVPPLVLPVLIAACDVTNPLLGSNGSARTYGPQKGATPAQIEILESGLRQLASVVGGDPDQPGAGSAGGAAFGLAAMCGASLVSGVDLVMDLLNLKSRVATSDLVITGEGRFDATSALGKVISGVAKVCAECQVPCIAIVGSAAQGALKHWTSHELPAFHRVVSLCDRFPEHTCLAEPAFCLEAVAATIARDLPSTRR